MRRVSLYSPNQGLQNGFISCGTVKAASVHGNPHNGQRHIRPESRRLIDEQDAIYNRLRTWIDANQDGIAQPEELHTLAELGVHSISLRYRESRRVDEYGNQSRYVAPIEDLEARRDNRCYDVFLVTK